METTHSTKQDQNKKHTTGPCPLFYWFYIYNMLSISSFLCALMVFSPETYSLTLSFSHRVHHLKVFFLPTVCHLQMTHWPITYVSITSSPWNLTQFPGLCEFTGHVCAFIQRKRISIFSHVSLNLVKCNNVHFCPDMCVHYTIYSTVCIYTHASYTVHRPTDTHVHARTKLCTRL